MYFDETSDPRSDIPIKLTLTCRTYTDMSKRTNRRTGRTDRLSVDVSARLEKGLCGSNINRLHLWYQALYVILF